LLKVVVVVDAENAQIKQLLELIAAENFQIDCGEIRCDRICKALRSVDPSQCRVCAAPYS
jgi:hypothetical protein